jgi:cell division septal protein FtsQ
MIHRQWVPRSRAFQQRARILQRRTERLRAATDERPGAETGGHRLAAVLARMLGLVALLALSGLLYDTATSPEFRIRQVTVSGNHLLTTDEVLAVAAVQGTNSFWVRRSEVAERVQRLAAVRAVDVRVALPGRVDLLIRERTPYVSWQSGDAIFLVDVDGIVLGTQTPEQPLIVIHDLDGPAPEAGQRVDLTAIRTVAALTQALPGALGLAPSEYDYSRAFGVEVQPPGGPRLRFGTEENLDVKLATLAAVQAELSREGTRPQLIDVRFPQRPYFR